MNEPARIWVEPVPLDKEIEGGQRKVEPRLKRGPGSMGHFLQMTDPAYYREHGFDQHPGIPQATSTEFQIGWISNPGMEGRITEYNHFVFEGFDQRMKSRDGRIGAGTIPRHDQPQIIQEYAELPPDNPAMIRFPFAPATPRQALAA
jgi:hypothetical protein